MKSFATFVSAALLLSSLAVEAQDPTTFTEMEIGFEVYRVAELQVTPIDLGTILINGEGGTVAMDASGRLSASGGVLTTVDGPFGAPRPGTLTLDADAGITATITLSPSVDLGGGVSFTPALDSASVAMTGSPVTVNVYGTLEIPPNTQTGSYDGLLTVDVSYN